MRWHPGLGLAAATTATLTAATVIWALTGTPPARPVSADGTARGDGWKVIAAELTSTAEGQETAAPAGTRFVILTFQVVAEDASAAEQLGCSVEFVAGARRWRPDNAAVTADYTSGCYQLEPGVPTAIGVSATVPEADADAMRAELTVGRTPTEPALVWFGGDTVVSIPG